MIIIVDDNNNNDDDNDDTDIIITSNPKLLEKKKEIMNLLTPETQRIFTNEKIQLNSIMEHIDLYTFFIYIYRYKI